MPLGPGKYDHHATPIRFEEGADLVAVIVIGGKRGNGFAVQGTPTLTLQLPELLERMAQDIRAMHTAGRV